MLRVKVFRLKDGLIKFSFGISIVLFIYFILNLVVKIIDVESRTFAAGIVEETISADIAFLDGGLNLQILEEELGLGRIRVSDIKRENLELINNNSEMLVKENLEDKKVNNDYNKYIASSEVKTWDRPKTYAVNQLSSGKIQVGSTYITNYTDKKLDLDELSKVSKFKINKDTNFLLVHTHTSEGYSECGVGSNFRTLDDNMNVVSVGDVLEKNLISKKFAVTHLNTKHDTPSYNGSYAASLKSVQEAFKKTKYDIVLDIHRDALSSNLNYRPTVEIDGESAAKLMFVVGTNASGLSHDNWMENLKLALLIQNTANEMYPGLFRDLNLSKSRYNQNVCDGALILEVGATGNTLEEVWNAMKYFSNVLEALKG